MRSTTRSSIVAIAVMVGSLLPSASVLGTDAPPPPPPPSGATTAAAGYYHPLDPDRILDTRSGNGATGKVGAGRSVSLQVAGRGGVPADASAVVMNVTVTQPTTAGYITVHPAGTARPTAANLNYSPGETVPNLVVAKLGDGGKVELFNSHGDTHLVADVMGWYDDLMTSFPTIPEGGSRQRAIAPVRLLDTRDRGTSIGPKDSIELQVAGIAGIPAEATAVALNVTVTQPTTAGYITVHPTGTDRTTTANLNFVAGQTVPNLVIAKVGAGGKVTLFNSHGNSHVIVDANAYFEPVSSFLGGGELTPLTPTRVLDTRIGHGAPRRAVRPGESLSLDVTGIAGVPESGVDSVVLNVAVTGPTKAGFVTAYPTGTDRPTAANLNFVAGQTVPNLVIAKVGDDGTVQLFNSHGETHLVADLAGWFNADVAAPAPPPGGPGTPGGFGSAGTSGLLTADSSSNGLQVTAKQRAFWDVHDPTEILEQAEPEPLLQRDGSDEAAATSADLSDATFWSGESEYQIWSQGYTHPGYDERIGRLLYWVPTQGRWSYCTATMVARNLAITAAHCVVDATNQLHANFAFFAGLSGNTAHGGIHTNVVDVIYPKMTSGLAAYLHGDYRWAADYAFIEFGATGGSYPGDTTGWHGIKLNPDLSWLLSYGYPGEGSYFKRYCTSAPQSQLQAWCYLYQTWGRYGGWHRLEGGWYEIGWGSDMSGGASGGPVFAYQNGEYRIVSLNSNGQVEVCDIWVGEDCAERRHVFNMWGPYFTSFVLDLYRANAV